MTRPEVLRRRLARLEEYLGILIRNPSEAFPQVKAHA